MRWLPVIALLATGPACAESLVSSPSCGGDAYSSAQVTENRPSRRGPITSVPDTLCADLEPRRGSTRIEIYGVPGIAADDPALGGRGRAAPYGEDSRGSRPYPRRDRGD